MEPRDSDDNSAPGAPIDPVEAAGAFAALGSAVRLSLLRQLVRAGQGGLSVGALQQQLGMPASTLSHHLRALIAAGVLEQERQGRTLICRARYDRVEALASFLLSECCADALAAGAHPDFKHPRARREESPA